MVSGLYNPDEQNEKVKKDNEMRKEYKPQWHQENKERLNIEGKELVRCDVCNMELTKYSLWNHNKSTDELHADEGLQHN